MWPPSISPAAHNSQSQPPPPLLQRLPFSFLKDIREKWHSKYRLREAMQARPYDMNSSFQSILKQKMVHILRARGREEKEKKKTNSGTHVQYGYCGLPHMHVQIYYSDDSTNQLRGVMEQVEDVKGAMISNIGMFSVSVGSDRLRARRFHCLAEQGLVTVFESSLHSSISTHFHPCTQVQIKSWREEMSSRKWRERRRR